MAVKVGFIGAGGIAGHHMNTMSANPDAVLTAFCDVDVSRARAAAKLYGGKAFVSHKTMLAKVDLDAVVICVPPFAHKTQERDVIEVDLPFFTEKPVGLSVRRCESNLELIKQKDVVTAVGYHLRYQDSAKLAREAVKGQTISLVQGQWIGGMPGVAWWRVMNESGGQAVEQTTHIFDLARYVVGEVTEVYATASTGNMTDVENYDVHDSSAANLVFESGAVGTIFSSCVVGPGGGVNLTIHMKDDSITVTGDFERDRPGLRETRSNSTNATDAEQRAFLKAVATGDRSDILCDYAEGLKTLKVSLAVNESIRKHKIITL
jgi:predicted dehydrogenase